MFAEWLPHSQPARRILESCNYPWSLRAKRHLETEHSEHSNSQDPLCVPEMWGASSDKMHWSHGLSAAFLLGCFHPFQGASWQAHPCTHREKRLLTLLDFSCISSLGYCWFPFDEAVSICSSSCISFFNLIGGEYKRPENPGSEELKIRTRWCGWTNLSLAMLLLPQIITNQLISANCDESPVELNFSPIPNTYSWTVEQNEWCGKQNPCYSFTKRSRSSKFPLSTQQMLLSVKKELTNVITVWHAICSSVSQSKPSPWNLNDFVLLSFLFQVKCMYCETTKTRI